MLTTDKPNREIDLISLIPGILEVACSIGKLINLSTSKDPKVDETVITCTWLEVISGSASTGSFINWMVPQMIQANVKRPITNLFLTENRIIAFNIFQGVTKHVFDAYLQHSFLVNKLPKKEKSLYKALNTCFIS
jgi:hypothetical protein